MRSSRIRMSHARRHARQQGRANAGQDVFRVELCHRRFNFRGVGASGGTFDEGIGETDDALAVLAYAQRSLGNALPIVLAGFSFGAYVQTRVAQRVGAQRLVLVGPAVRRFAVESVPADTIVIHGEEDDVVSLADVFAWARPQQLPIVVFPGCGHFFHGRLPQLQRLITGMWQRTADAHPSSAASGSGQR